MSDRMTIARLRERCENLNRRMEQRGSNVRYEVGRRYDYTALDRCRLRPNGETYPIGDPVRVGTKTEIGELLYAMMVVLDDALQTEIYD